MDEAYEAAAKAIHEARPESEDEYSHRLCGKYAKAAVDAFLAEINAYIITEESGWIGYAPLKGDG